ncbi:MAG: hypothetical protein HY556_07885 [Euryarchaeota archaeon]|nr:hypothetical protein [Euryarchaeota archaeon]
MPERTKDDIWWRKRVGILSELGGKISDIEPDFCYEKQGYWPAVKLVIMQYLVGPYVKIMANQREAGRWDSLHYVDLCAGSGLTRVSPKKLGTRKTGPRAKSITLAGSALIGANEPGFDLYHFVEPGLRKSNVLDQRLKKLLPPERIRTYRKPAEAAIPGIIEAMKARSTKPHFLAVADPEGLGEVTLTDLGALTNVGRGDFIFNFQFQGVNRAKESATRFFGTPAWPQGGNDEAVKGFFETRLADIGRPATVAFDVKSGKSRYAYEIVYSAAQTKGGNEWLWKIATDLRKRVDWISGRTLESILFGQDTLF